jgi:hypothetical protein
VVTTNIDGGAVLEFTTSDVNGLADLRAGVREMALQIAYVSSPTSAATGAQTGISPPNRTPGMPEVPSETTTPSGATTSMPVPRSTANVMDIPNGARLEILAISPSDVANVRDLAEASAEQLRSGDCAMAFAARTQPARPGLNPSYREIPG